MDIETLITKYRLFLCRLAYTYVKNTSDAEDVVQDVFAYAFFKKIHFANELHERAWLTRAVVHKSINLLKKSSRKDVPYEQEKHDKIADDNAGKRFVLEAVMSLPEKYKAVIHLYYFEGCIKGGFRL